MSVDLTTITKSTFVPAIPIEDLKDNDVCHSSQLLPTDVINVPMVYDLAYSGLSIPGIAGKLRIPKESVVTHFSKTIAAARAEAALAAILYIQDIAAGNVQKVNKAQYEASIYLLEKRLDPSPKDPQIVIAQSFSTQSPLYNVPLQDLNDL
jgi:hypothetical protein